MARRFKRCYEKSLKSDPNAHGKVELVVELHPDGRVREVRGQTDQAALEFLIPCLAEVVRRERFSSEDPCEGHFVIPILFVPGD